MLLSVILSLGVAVVPALILHLIRIPAGTSDGYVARPARVGVGAEFPATPKFPSAQQLPAAQQLLSTPKPPASPKPPVMPTLRPPAIVTVTASTKPRPRAAPTRTVAPATTATTTKPPQAVRVHSQTGQASWYGGTKGNCAHRTIPLRTVVKVVNLDNGRETHCTVTNRGPYMAGRVIDLTKPTFAELAPAGRGVINVRIEW